MFESWETELVGSARHATLGTIGASGRPHLVPVCYAFVEGNFAVAIDEKPKAGPRLARLRNIERDPRVSLLIERYDEDWTRLAWLRIDGWAAIAALGSERPAVIAALRARYPQYLAMNLEERPLIVIAPERTASWRWDTTRR